jgi:hypothetical protein
MVFHKHWLWIGYEDAESEILSEACNALHELSFLPPPSQAKILSRKFSLNIHMSKRITISQYLCSKLNLLNNFSLTYFYISTYRGIM